MSLMLKKQIGGKGEVENIFTDLMQTFFYFVTFSELSYVGRAGKRGKRERKEDKTNFSKCIHPKWPQIYPINWLAFRFYILQFLHKTYLL